MGPLFLRRPVSLARSSSLPGPCNLSDRALKAFRERPLGFVGHGSDARPTRLRMLDVFLRGTAAAFDIDLTSDGICRQRLFEHRRESRRRRKRDVVCSAALQ